MKTQTKYEEIILTEIRTLPMPGLPQALKMLRLLKEDLFNAAKLSSPIGTEKTGFCGGWQDERSADAIIADIALHRSGFGGRRVNL